MTRRHRLNEHEIDPVKQAVENMLIKLCRELEDELTAITLFKVWWRLEIHREGNPAYPDPINWGTISDHLMVPLNPVEKVIPFEDMEILSVWPRTGNIITHLSSGQTSKETKA